MEQLIDYARNRDAQQLPAGRAVNRAVGAGGARGWAQVSRGATARDETQSVVEARA